MRADRERNAEEPAKAARSATRHRENPSSPRDVLQAPGIASAADVLRLQHIAGNRAVSRTLQRSPQDERTDAGSGRGTIVSRPGGRLHALTPDVAEAIPVKNALLKRLTDGPVFSDAEIADLKAQGRSWLNAIGTGRYEDAVAYSAAGKYYDWLKLAPGKRLLIATVEWRERKGRTEKSPAFTLGRHLDLRGGAVPEDERDSVTEARDAQIREAFVDTLAPPFEDSVPDSEAHRKNARANTILTNVFLILQNGLKVYDPDAEAHVDFTDGDVARALAHGGRVNIRIPALGEADSPTALPDWLGVTENGKNPNKAEKRSFATHHMSIDGDKFEEQGGMSASLRNVFPFNSAEGVKLWGLPLAADGMGGHDFNGDVILPDNGHGHMLLVFTPPRRDRDGALEVGIETVGPGGPSPVGHTHNILSTEATANPESSFYGHKKDKIGGGKLKDNQRYVALAELSNGGDWQKFLDELQTDWADRLHAAGDDLNARRALYGQLVGRREGRFTPPAGAPPAPQRAKW
ncbi:hypothetical protein OOZ19_03925 [Saccharopolyspora sp. NFXS83]|uniref:hypothetical protein n=1 Tax=Saccharopolyspora sp. NFXS83 TaxID=2993560 RepID=UPI00224B4FFF|nr:hypothetical protein [Saccharopolyspora sp. NFXS83]MCX2729378.1 hypothetical protein [Saccharopolyspora sp. NFXS83]